MAIYRLIRNQPILLGGQKSDLFNNISALSLSLYLPGEEKKKCKKWGGCTTSLLALGFINIGQ